MKKFIFYIISFTIVCNTLLAAPPTNWTLTKNFYYKIPEDIYFSSDRLSTQGWAITSDEKGMDTVFRSVDGGVNWSGIPITGSRPKNIYATDETHAWIAASNAVWYSYMYKLLYFKWASAPIPEGIQAQLYDVYFHNNTLGWAVGEAGLVMNSKNGGVNWIIQTHRKLDGDIKCVRFVDEKLGFIATSSGFVYSTQNGGSEWVLIGKLGVSINDMTLTQNYIHLAADNGYYFKANIKEPKWEYREIKAGKINKLSFINENEGWLATNNGVYITKSAGEKWVSLDDVWAILDIRSIHFINSTTGWASVYDGKYGLMMKTIKGGCKDPYVNLGTDRNVCGNPFYLSAYSSQNQGPTYLWTESGSTSSSIYVKSPYNTPSSNTVTVTNICGFSASDNVILTLKEKPTVFAGRDTGLLMGQTFTIPAQSTGANTYLWSDATNLSATNILNPDFTVPGSLKYTKTLTATNTSTGCFTSSSITIEGFSFATMPYGWVSLNTQVDYSDITDIWFNGDIGWAAHPDKLLYSANGGATWSTNTGTGLITGIKRIQFTSPTTGWILNSSTIATTSNTGVNWSSTSSSFGSNVFNDFYMVSPSAGWMVGNKGVVYKTTGSNLWTAQTSNTGSDLTAVHFVDANTGYACGANGVLIKTTNGGTNWSKITTGMPVSPALTDIFFTNAQTGFITWQHRIYRTTNSGTSWDLIYTNNNYTFNRIWFTSSKIGFVASQDGVFRTSDGGNTWSYLSVSGNDMVDFKAVMFVDTTNGWVGGSAGRIYRTSGGGCKFIPRVELDNSLFACNGDSITLNAIDSIRNNDCVYQWKFETNILPYNTGIIKIPLNVGKYYARAINQCNKVAFDSIMVNQYPLVLADAGANTTICRGVNHTLIAKGGVSYLWSPNDGRLTNTNKDSTVLTTNSFRDTGVLKYEVLVTDTNGCKAIDSIKITVKPTPSAIFNLLSTNACLNDSLQLSIPNYIPSAIYSWALDGAGKGDSKIDLNYLTIKVKWSSIGQKNIKLTTQYNNCSDTSGLISIQVKPSPIASFQTDKKVCPLNDTLNLSFNGTVSDSALFTWETSDATVFNGIGQNKKLVFPTGGTKSLGLSVNDNGCITSVNQEYEICQPIEVPICMVTVDMETGNNLVVWERKQNKGVQSYNVYRQGNVAGKYELLKTLPFNELSTYVDLTSKHENQAEYYKLTTVDTCGNEFPIANAKSHKTIFLQYVSSVGGVNLNWDYYEVNGSKDSAKFDSYVLYKGLDSSKLQIVATVASNINRYTDTDADAQIKRYYYRVGGLRTNACAPATLQKANSGPFSHSVSNLEDNRLRSTETGVNQTYNFAFNIVPNPLVEEFEVKFYAETKGILKIDLFNSLGKSELQLMNTKVLGGNQKFNFNASKLNISKGIYFLKVTFNGSVSTKKIVIQ